MSKEEFERILNEVAKVKEEIEAIPGSTANGQLIDASCHAKCIEEHLKRYYALTGGKL